MVAESPFASLRRIARIFAKEHQQNRDSLLAQQRLVQMTPALLAREAEIDRDWEAGVAQAFRDRAGPGPGGGLPARVLAGGAIYRFVFRSLYRLHAFNGDPHPGNYLFHEDGGVTFLDFGCVKRFEGPFLSELRNLNRAILERDEAAFEAALRATGIVLPGRPFDRAASWAFFDYHARPFARDEVFTFTADYLLEAGQTMRLDSIKRFNLPPDLVLFNRITFGLNAIFQRLGASENFHRHYRRYIYAGENVPPSLASVGVALPTAFLPARPWPLKTTANAACVPVGVEARSPAHPERSLP